MYGLWWIFIGIISCGALVLIINIIVDTVEYGFDPVDWDWGWTSFIVSAIVDLGIVLPLCILLPIQAHKEVIKYTYDYEMVQEVVLNGKDLENIKITETILNYNNWLSEAKADKETWDSWSVYYKEDLDSLKPIVVSRNNKK